MSLYLSTNAVMPTTAAQVALATGTAIKTHQQIAAPAASGIQIVAFGVEFATVLVAPATVELIETDVAATVTAHVAAGVQPYDVAALGGASLVTLGTSATGYAASAEGSITATRLGKEKILPIGASSYEWEWSLGREFAIAKSKFARIRITTGTTVNVTTWIIHQE